MAEATRQEKKPKHYEIFVNRRKFEASTSPMTALAILELAGYDAGSDLYLLHGEGDSTGGEKLDQGAEVELKNGMHFRAVPGNANFG